MRLPNRAHTSRPWRIHELTRDFRLEDVWALPTPGGPDDFPRLVQLISSGDPSRSSSRAARSLWAIRWKVGELLGWDSPKAGLGSRVPTLRDRLPEDLREAPSGPGFHALPFTSLYLLDEEWAAEIANRTMHGVLHIGWVREGTGGYRGQMAVYVKPNGLLGTAYMAAIRPFRHLIVYPAMLRQLARRWRASTGQPAADGAAPPTQATTRPEVFMLRTVAERCPHTGTPSTAKTSVSEQAAPRSPVDRGRSSARSRGASRPRRSGRSCCREILTPARTCQGATFRRLVIGIPARPVAGYPRSLARGSSP